MENLNSVCYVASIDEIKPIVGADNIELILAGGWNCITKKGEYKVGDLIILATTDAVIPTEISEQLGIKNYLRGGSRVRTVKLRGVYSESLLIPLTYAPEKYRVVGKDCMEVLGIFKYEPPVETITLPGGRKVKYKKNPNFHVYYKFPNLKNVAGLFNESDEVQITRKLHGTNARYGFVKKQKLSFFDRVKKFFGVADEWIDYEFVIGSHNVQKTGEPGFYDKDVWLAIAKKYDIKNKLSTLVKLYTDSLGGIGTGFIVYGEIYGPGIQSNYDYGMKEIDFAIFDIEVDSRYLPTYTTHGIATELLKIPHVPILADEFWSQELQDKFVFNNFIEGTKVPHEGIVIKEISGDRRKVAKVINPDYLIYGEKHNVGDSH
jgi:RNA ligase (TIGR02306 family)